VKKVPIVVEITEEKEEGIVAFESTVMAPICSYGMTDATEAVEAHGDFLDYFDSLDTSCKDDCAITSAAAVFDFTPDD